MGDKDDPQIPTTLFMPESPITVFQAGVPGTISAQDVQKIQDVQRKITDSVAQAKTQDKTLSSQGAGTDPSYAKTEEHFASMTHEQIHSAVFGGADGSGGMDAAGLHQLRQTWFEAASDLENLSSFNLLGMNNIFNHGLWQGTSGNAAQAASERIAHAANQIGQVFEAVSQRLDSMAWAADAIRLAVPPVPAGAATATPNPDNSVQSILPGLINPAYADNLEKQRKAARDAAVQAMQTLYAPSYPPAGTDVPAYTDVPQVGGSNPGPSNPAAPSPIAHSNGPSATNAQHTTGPNAQNPDAQNQQQTNPSAADSGNGGHSNGTTPAGLGLPSTAANNTSTPSATTTAGYTPSTSVPSSADAAGLGGVSNPGSRASTTGGGPGSSRAGGTPGSASPTAGATRTPTTAAGTNATRMPTSMGPHAGKHGDKDEDEHEHYSPDYLRGVQPDWTDGLETPVEVIGSELTSTDHDSYTPTTAVPAAHVPAQSSTTVTADNANTTHSTDAPAAEVPRTPDNPPESTPTEPTEPPEVNPALASLFAEYGWSTGSTKDAAQKEESAEGAEPVAKPSDTDQ